MLAEHPTSPRPHRGLRALEVAEERELAGRMSGVLYLTGAVSAPLVLLLPGTTTRHWQLLLAVAAAGAVWSLCCLRWIPWPTAPPLVSHASTFMGFAVVATAVACTGGAQSPTRFFLFFIVVFAAYFYPPREAIPYLMGCGLVHALPLLYDSDAVQGGFLGELLVVVPTYLVLGGGIVAGKRILVLLRERAESLAAEQGALRRVATAVASGEDPKDVYARVAEETARLLGAPGAGILRFDDPVSATVTGSWRDGARRLEPGSTVPIKPGDDLDECRRVGRAVRVDRQQAGSPVDALGYGATIVAPVRVGDRTWGALAVGATEATGLRADAEERLSGFAELLASAISNTEDRAKLAAQASTDPLTGLANHRTFHERLREEVGRARRHGHPLSLAVIDVDNFKHVNDTAGHEKGDQILAHIARRLEEVARAEDILARIGGDEFAILFPETKRLEAFGAIERARQLVSAERLTSWPITISAGVCDLSAAGDADAMFRLADGALYWSKAHGRDVCWIYDPTTVRELSVRERAENLERSQALHGLRALARAIDAKDPTTRQHSDRVADLVARLAEVRGWTPERTALLTEAALVHDVGKVGVPDAILLKPAALTPEEYEEVKRHAALSAQIAEEVLGGEQVSWIRAHHERPDGRGYPDGLAAPDIPEGAALLALADAWDVMTVSRPYSVPKDVGTALAECRELVDAQFTATAIEALVALHGEGALSVPDPGQVAAPMPAPR